MSSVKEHLSAFHRSAGDFHKNYAQAHTDISHHHGQKAAHHHAQADESDGELAKLHRSLAETHDSKAQHHAKLAKAHQGMMTHHQAMLNEISTTPTVGNYDSEAAQKAAGDRLILDQVRVVIPSAPYGSAVTAVPRPGQPQLPTRSNVDLQWEDLVKTD
jgi:hypothetical protein